MDEKDYERTIDLIKQEVIDVHDKFDEVSREMKELKINASASSPNSLDGGVRARKSNNTNNIDKTNSNQLKEENASEDEHHLGHETSSRRLVIEEFQSTPAR